MLKFVNINLGEKIFMLSMNNSDRFVKSQDIIFAKDDISYIDCSRIEQLEVKVVLKNGKEFLVHEIHALEIVMQCKPSLLEGKRLKWPRFVWIMHNLIGHPLFQILALFKAYKWAFWLHDVTVPKPLGKYEKKEK